jgi:hypothetical protein
LHYAAYSTKPSALHYTRRPSGTNNHSTVPHVHRRMSSSTSSSSGGHVRGNPRSAPPHSSSTEEDEGYSDLSVSSRENLEMEESISDVPSEKGSASGGVKVRLDAERAKRTRNRASLPAYFSLLQINYAGGGDEPRSSPVSSSSGRTVARPSPPTPKLAVVSRRDVDETLPGSSAIHTTPRGRRRVAYERSLDCSYSGSRLGAEQSVMFERDAGDEEQEPTRGRRAVRRNSSPPAKMEERGRILGMVLGGSDWRRGRARVSELDGIGCSAAAPGLGNGRSGLVGRERARERERSGAENII